MDGSNKKLYDWILTLTIVLLVFFVMWIIYVCVKQYKIKNVMNMVSINPSQADSVQTKYLLHDILNNQVCCMPFVSTKKMQKIFMSSYDLQSIVLAMMYSITQNNTVCVNKLLDDTFLILNQQQQQQPQQPVEGYQAIPDDIPPLVDIEWC